MRCHYTVHEGQRIWIPGDCSAGYTGRQSDCTCYEPWRKEIKLAGTEAKQRIKALEAENTRLNRILFKLLKSKRHS